MSKPVNEILLQSYWEHFKREKELAMYLPLKHPKRVKIRASMKELLNQTSLTNE